MLRNIFVGLSSLLLAQAYIVQQILYSLEIRIATAVVYNQKVFVMAAVFSSAPGLTDLRTLSTSRQLLFSRLESLRPLKPFRKLFDLIID